MTKRDWLPLSNFTGKRPVRSDAAHCDLSGVTEIGEGMISDSGVGVSIRGQADSAVGSIERAEATFFLAWSRWPSAVAGERGVLWRMSFAVRH